MNEFLIGLLWFFSLMWAFGMGGIVRDVQNGGTPSQLRRKDDG